MASRGEGGEEDQKFEHAVEAELGNIMDDADGGGLGFRGTSGDGREPCKWRGHSPSPPWWCDL